jgi:ribonuclease VapC
VNESFVLDSFALLALLGREPGSEEVAKLLRRAQQREARVQMSWVNAGEVAYILERRFGLARSHTALALMDATGLEVVPVERELALLAAHIKAGQPIAYADTFAAALAQQAAATLVTGDLEFKKLEGAVDILWLPQGEAR